MIYRYFLAFWIFTSSIVAVQSTQYGLLGETVTFKTDITDPPDDILWKHNGNKVVHFDGSKQISYSLFENRVAVDWHSAELEVNHLTHSDSGQYEMDAAYKGRVIRLNYELRVLDRVTKPTIICHMSDGSSSDKSGSEATLMCSTNTSQSLNYEWSQPGKNQSGQILTIPLGTEHDDKVYSCTVSNRLSKEIATFTAKDCYPVGVSTGLIAGLVIGGIVILLCVLSAVFCALKHKACFAKEEKTDHASDQPSEPLLHRTETRPSSQRLHHLGEIGKNSNYDHKDEKHNELDPQTEKGLENNESKPEKIGPPVPKKPHLSKVNQGQADVNDDDLQSPTASENPGLENNKDEPKKVKPLVPEKSFKIRKGQANINPPREVPQGNGVEEHSGATESGLQSSTASQKPVVGEEVNSQQVTGEKQENESVEMTKKKEPPTIPEPTGLENNEGKPEKIGPPVPNKPHLSKVNQGQADVNDDDLQSPTASENPGLENNKVKPDTIKPALPKKPPSVKISKGQTDSNPPSKDKVSEVGCFEEHSGATESDLQSFTAAQKPVVGEEVNSQQVTGEKQENESVEMTKKKEPPTIPEPTGLENNEGKPEKIGPPVPNKPHLSKVNQGQADVNDDDLQSPTASENPGLENNKVKPDTIKPALPKKPPSVKISKGQTDSNPPSKDKVSEVGCFEEHSGATESDLQSFTAAQKPVVGEEVNSQQVTGEKQENESVEMTKKKEPPTISEPTGLENNEGKPEKIGPPVPNKPHLSKVNQGQADVNDDDLQSPTASENPDPATVEHKEENEKQDGASDDVTEGKLSPTVPEQKDGN